ncbi:helix-turn-helix domain-containing protein [Mucilaginibacter mali]|uniref:Helix-turn-helix domain-containing protein n=1 Tax=Mucilaginibacter mali TaxID=2740462 RepID=A0A7D4TNX6_9SPHI|nr:helix-turn-helix domain-containing protein [Mucilaginibacter mali]QKJ30274.1 helix-turn-helix domain-containing protein [Mucilaginibacter mali]
MNFELITLQDLNNLKNELLGEIRGIKKMIQPGGIEPKQWLKSYEVKKLLKISSGTLQNLRINGTLRYTKIGGLLYYKYEDIMNLLEQNSK